MSEISESKIIIQFLNQDAEIISIDGHELIESFINPCSIIGQSALKVYQDHNIIISDIKKALKGSKTVNEIRIDNRHFRTKCIPTSEKDNRGVLMIWNDTTEHREKQIKIQESELRFKTLFELANDSIFMMDSKTFVDCNSATLRIFKCKREQIIGETPFRFSPPIQPDGRSSEESAMEKIMAAMEGNAQFFEWKHIHYDGTPFDAEVSLNRLDIGDNVFVQAIVRDITERKEAEQAIQKNNEELRQINEELDRFVYSASHDLRAPIASLLGLVNLLKKQSRDVIINDLITLQEKSLNKLDYFIQEIVDYSRNKRIKLESKPINFKTEINETFELLNFMDNVDKIKLKVEVIGNVTFNSDPFRIKIIFNNLISNAIKYADLTKKEPIIKVSVNLTEDGADISVKDNGEGVDEISKHRLFEMFYRASEKGSGSGLGLYIVKESLEKLNGRITVESKLNEGTEFNIHIPNTQ